MAKALNVLVAYDGSPSASSALDDLGRAGLPDGTTVTVFTAADIVAPNSIGGAYAPPLATQIPSAAEQIIEDARGLARGASRRLQARHPTWQVRAETSAGLPAAEIVRKAMDWQLDLLVVGCGCKSWLGRLLQGSVSRSVTLRAPCSVRVGRARPTAGGWPLHLVVGANSPAALEAAIRALSQRTWPSGSEVLLLVAGPLGQEGGPADLAMTTAQALTSQGGGRLPRALEAAADALHSHGITVSMAAKQGSPERAIVDVAKKWNADAILLSDVESVAQQDRARAAFWIATHVRCSVEIIRRI